ncbi:NADH-quinone oxidoreductase subunit NuoE family protein [Aquisphaera insulae]|uniref:NADH-quinone oxidoreductase subunit NuoE family protein n=1 Tax=Aquisphaera insulae TaxID=2712864 RepID=UPI0013ED6D0F|nr:NAD(P)H-dependent oxidoreductase subunit E [Aquisphaera insulae]
MPAEAPTKPAKAPMLSEALRQRIRDLFPRYPSKRAVTLPALHLVLEHFRCVPLQAMEEIAELLEIAPAEVHDTMSFYGFFPQAPLGDVRVWICRSISCMLRGGDELLEHACKRSGIEHGETTADGKLTIDYAECLGICDHAPAALADDGRIFGPLDEAGVDAMLDELKKGRKDPA